MRDCASLSSPPPPNVGARKPGLSHCSLITGLRRCELRFHSNPSKPVKLLKDLTSRNRRCRRTRRIPVSACENSGESSHRRVEDDDGPVPAAAPLDDRLDFLGLEREVEKEESPSDGGEDVREAVEQTRPRRRMMKRSSLMAKQVISVKSARSLGFVSQLWVDTRSWVVVLLEARPNLLSGENDKFYLEDVCQVGDVVLVQDESWIENNELRMAKLDTLVSTYCLFVEDVLEVVADTIVVTEDAVSRVQMLTKGFLDTPNAITSGSDLDGYSDTGKRGARVVQSRRPKWSDSKHQKAPSKMREFEDDWDLPMDY